MTDVIAKPSIIYPESDGKPMGETGIHPKVIMSLIYMLDHYFRKDPQVYVAGNMFLYYEEGNPGSSFCPDVFFSRGIGKEERRTYKLWEEGKPPDLIIEVTSKSSRFEDLKKRAIYGELGVQEYYVFDPLNEYLSPPFRGFRLQEGGYVQMEPSAGRIQSEVTGLELTVKDRLLRFIDPSTGEFVPTYEETCEAESRARAALEQEGDARRAAETKNEQLAAEVARLKEELKRLSK